MIPMVDLKIQYKALQEEIMQGITETLENAHFILGPRVKAFEDTAAEYLGVKHAFGVASGTDALQLAIVAAGLKEGDEVITPPFSFMATASTIVHAGAKPVFVDIDPRTFNIDPAKIEAAITPKTRAILPVHLFGQPANMAEIMEIAQRHNLKVIEDAAQSFGASYADKMTGGFGIAGCYSFYPSKNLSCYGDGGMVVTNSDEMAERLLMLRNHGSKVRYHHDMCGYASRLDEIQAVVLLAKLKRLDSYNQNRQRVARTYNQLLEGLPITLPYEDSKRVHIYHQYTILTDKRDALIEGLKKAQIATMIYYPIPIHRQKVFADVYSHMFFPHSESVAERCLSLPIFPEMTEQQIQQVSAVVREVLVG